MIPVMRKLILSPFEDDYFTFKLIYDYFDPDGKICSAAKIYIKFQVTRANEPTLYFLKVT